MDRQSAFSKLKPLCISILKECSPDNIQQIQNVVQELDRDSAQSLLEFVILPVRARLGTPLPEKTVISCVSFLSSVFRKCEISDMQLFSDVFTLLVSKLCDPENPNQVLTAYEEVKLTVCDCLCNLVRSSTERILNEMYSLGFRPKLAHALFMLNRMLGSEKSKHLLVSVLSTIGTLTYCQSEVGQCHALTEEIASEALASCLPGLTIGLQKVICGDYKQGHSVVTKALRVLTDFIVLVLGDCGFEKNHASNPSSEVYLYAYECGKLTDSIKGADANIPIVLKNEAWLETVSGNLQIIVQNIVGHISNSDHWKVRQEFLNFSSSLLLACTKTLENCIPVLLPTVFRLIADEMDSISKKSREFLRTFTKHFETVNSFSLLSVIEENLMHIASEIINSKLSMSDHRKLTSIQCLYGYIEILSSQFESLLFSMPVINKIVISLLIFLEFDQSVLNVIEEIPDLESLNISDLSWPKKKFEYFDDENILKVVSSICYTLGRIKNSQVIVDLLVEKLSDDAYVLQGIFLIATILKDLTFDPDLSEKYHLMINDVLETLLSSELIDPPFHESNISGSECIGMHTDVAVPSTEFNKIKLQICLVLEAIGRCAECLKTEFKTYLMKCLCPIMEKAGSSNFVISQYGCLCLCAIAKSCEYDSINDLIKNNADYITNVLLINFNSFFFKPEVAVVLKVALKQCDSEALVLFRDLIFQILHSIDYCQEKSYFLMHILYSVVTSIQKWFPGSPKITENVITLTPASKGDLKSAVLEYITLNKAATDVNDDTEQLSTELDPEVQTEDFDDYPDTEKKPEIPLHVNITSEIFRRCIHLQSAENPYFRMLVLDIVQQSITVLSDHESELHPLVHEFWDPFLKRFLEESFISKAFSVLMTIVNECKDFVRHRTFKDVMPKLILFLKREHSRSNTKNSYKNYQWSKDHSIQIQVLSEMGPLCSRLDVDNKAICDVANVCLPYLEKTQPKVLQDVAAKSLKELSKLNPDAVWYLWHVLYSREKVFAPNDDSFKPIIFPFSDGSLIDAQFDKIL